MAALRMLFREVCTATIENKMEKIRGKGKNIQIDKSKVGKRKYCKGQWVFSRIEQDSQMF